jgi:hypothetical protein
MTSSREISISLDPVVAVHVDSEPSNEAILIGGVDSDFFFHLDSVGLGTSLDEGPIESISVESGEDERLSFQNMVEPFHKECFFVRLVEDSKSAHVKFCRWRVLKVLDILSDNLPIGDKEPSSIDDIGNHHNLVEPHVRELEGRLCGLNIESHDA